MGRYPFIWILCFAAILAFNGCSDGGGGSTSRTAADLFIGASVEGLPPEAPVEHGAPAERFFYPQGTFRFQMMDVNGDGLSDIVTASAGRGFGSVRLGLGDGAFGDFQVFDVPSEIPFIADLAIEAADITGDGAVDLLMSCFASDVLCPDIYVYPGLGDGEFLDPIRTTFDSSVYLASSGDADEDGRSDVLVWKGSESALLLGDFDGTFTEMALPDVPGGWMQLIDFDGDGHVDLLSEDSVFESRSLGVALGNGDGTFDESVALQFEEELEPWTLGDLDNDGFMDRVGVSAFAPLAMVASIYNNDGTFSVRDELSLPVDDPRFELVDFDGDGALDLVVVSRTSFTGDDRLYLAFGNGDGTFADSVITEFGHPVDSFRVGRINGDGVQDLVISSDGWAPYEGRADGTFIVNQKFPTQGIVSLTAAADVTGDGIADIVADSFMRIDLGVERVGVSVVPGNGDGTFGAEIPIPVSGAPDLEEPVDLNGDGVLDLVTTNFNTSDISVIISNGDGTFRAERRYPVGQRPEVHAFIDLNADTYVDMVIANDLSEDISILLGNGDGTFQPEQRLPGGSFNEQLTVHDMDGDDFPDIVVSGSSNRGVTSLGVIDAYYNDSSGRFGPASTMASNVTNIFRIADIYRDGVPDIVAVRRSPSELVVALGKTDGPRLPEGTVPIGHNSSSLVVADLDGDGDDDFIVVSRYERTLSFFFSQSDGSIEAGEIIPTPFGAIAVDVEDVNDDGLLDLVVSEFDIQSLGIFSRLEIFLNLGDGQFVETDRLTFDLVGSSGFLQTDVNGDGLPDFAIAVGGSMSIFLNTGDGAFFDSGRFAVPSGGLVGGDFDRDGNLDFATSSSLVYGNFVYVMLNQSSAAGQLASPVVATSFFDD